MDERKSLILIPEEGGFLEEGQPDLGKIQKEKYQKALTNLVSGQTPKDAVFQKPMGRGVSVDYVPGWWFVEQLNALFGYYWDFEIESHEVGTESCWVKGKLTIKDPKSNLTVTKSAFGGSKIKSKGNPAIDIGDDLKSAATDALKKAATLLGIAADIYGRREVQSETSSKTQLTSLYSIAEKRSISKEKIEELSQKEFSKSLDELTEIDILALIRKVRSLATEKEVSNAS